MNFILGLFLVGAGVFAYTLITESWSARKLQKRIREELYRANTWDKNKV